MKGKFTNQNWNAVKNISWGESHKMAFGDRAGYVICYKDRGQFKALASVIGMLFVPQQEIDANAKLIEQAPNLYHALVTVLDKLSIEFDKYPETFKVHGFDADFITELQLIIKKAS